MASNDSTTSPPKNWKEKLAELNYQVRVGHDAAVLESLQRQRALNERLVKKSQDGTLGKPTSDPEDAMGVNVGNTIHHNYGTLSSAIPATTPSPAAPQPNVNSLSALVKVGIASLLVAAGALGGPLVTAALNPPAVVVPAPSQPIPRPIPQIGRDYRLGVQVIPQQPQENPPVQ